MSEPAQTAASPAEPTNNVIPIYVCSDCGTWRYVKPDNSLALRPRTYADAPEMCGACMFAPNIRFKASRMHRWATTSVTGIDPVTDPPGAA